MLELFREPHSPTADWVEAELREMVLAFERVIVTPTAAAAQFGEAVSLPVLRDGARLASGKEELTKFLRDLEKFAHQWRMFQGDFCYVDEDGEIC
ncbi:MAG: hypothetical protein Fur0022_40050 [Anaerolineales bacterium]